MKPEFWKKRWEENQIGFHQSEPNRHLQKFWDSFGLNEQSRVFVPLCGKSLDLLWLAQQGHRVLGVEVSPKGVADFFEENLLRPEISEQQGFLSYRSDEIEILQGDFFALHPELLNGIEAVYDRASLIAMPDEMRKSYAHQMANILPSRCDCLLVSLEYDPQEMKGPPFSVPKEEIEDLFGDSFSIKELHRKQIIEDQPRFQQRGLTSLVEAVYQMKKT